VIEEQQHINPEIMPAKPVARGWRKKLTAFAWMLVACGVVLLLVAAATKKNEKKCTDIDIYKTSESANVFVDEDVVRKILNSGNPVIGKEISTINLHILEDRLKKDPWILNADLFFDNNQVLNVSITEREPVARVFTEQGSSFYVDKDGVRLPLTDKLYAVVPVFTGFTSEKKILASPDSALLQQIVVMGSYILKDSFWNAQIGQIDIVPVNNFNITPVIGNQVIEFGDTTNMKMKFDKLFKFYRATYAKAGFEKYEKLNVKYEGQIVASRKGAAKPASDSSRALQAFEGSMQRMQNIMRDTSLPVIDTTDTH